MFALGKDTAGFIVPRVSLARGYTTASVTNVAGNPIDITSLGSRANSVAAIVGLQANLDQSDTATLSGVRLQSSDVVTFGSNVVDRVTNSGLVLTGVGSDNVDYAGEVELNLDLSTLPATHKFIRVVANVAMSDTTNTAFAAVSGVLVFGGLARLP